jgi:Protein of unknown function (DUF3037)
MTAYTRLLQFGSIFPDVSRLESVNVGVLLFCPSPNFIAVRMAKGNQRPARLAGRRGMLLACSGS